jgi:hypothetical protein
MISEFSRQIYEKYSNTKFHENPSGGSRVVPCGQMKGRTGHGEANSRFSPFSNKRLKMAANMPN